MTTFLFLLLTLLIPQQESTEIPEPIVVGESDIMVIDEPAELIVWQRPIFTFRASYKNLAPEARMERATQSIDALPIAGERQIVVIDSSTETLARFILSVDGTTVFGLVEKDLDPESETDLATEAKAAAARLSEVLDARWRARRIPLLVRGIALAIAATLLYFVLMKLLGRVFGFFVDRVPKFLPKIKISWHMWGFDLQESIKEIRLFTIRLMSLAAGISLTYVWVTFSLMQFPYTEPWSKDLGDLLLDALQNFADGFMNAIPGLFIVFIILSVTRMVVRLVGAFFSAIERGAARVEWLEMETAKATRRIVTVIIWLFGLTFAYPYVPGSGTVAFQGISVFIGLLVTVGSTGLVNQVMSGLVVLYSRTLKAGDYVQVGENEGVVSEVGFLSTRIATPMQEELIIPNAVLTGQTTRNLSRISKQEGVVVSTSITIGYDTPWRQVVNLMLMAAAETEDIRKTPEPFVLQRNLSDFYVQYDLIFHVDKPSQRPRILSHLHEGIQDAFNDAGVQIMSPHFIDQPDDAVVVPKKSWGQLEKRSEE